MPSCYPSWPEETYEAGSRAPGSTFLTLKGFILVFLSRVKVSVLCFLASYFSSVLGKSCPRPWLAHSCTFQSVHGLTQQTFDVILIG